MPPLAKGEMPAVDRLCALGGLKRFNTISNEAVGALRVKVWAAEGIENLVCDVKRFNTESTEALRVKA